MDGARGADELRRPRSAREARLPPRATLFLVGAGGEVVGHALYGSLPAWEETLLFDVEAVGLVVGFFSPFVFGIALPLPE